MLLSNQILAFLKALKSPGDLPKGVDVLNPYQDKTAMSLCDKFYHKYYADNDPRILILGINPGRFGGGVTGIPFTDPIRLENSCGIKNDLDKKPELSCGYIYQMIDAFGGPKEFYHRFYISSVSPLGFTMNSKNLNYYDIRALETTLTPFIIAMLKKQIAYGLRTDICFCLGEGANFKFVSKLNTKHHFFDKLVPLSHPRFILQYRRKQTEEYIQDYIAKFNAVK